MRPPESVPAPRKTLAQRLAELEALAAQQGRDAAAPIAAGRRRKARRRR